MNNQQRICAIVRLQNDVKELRRENETLKTLLNAVKQVVLDNRPKDGVDGAPGKDGAPGRDGERGERGIPGRDADITVVGNAELTAAVAKLRSEKARAQAAFLVAIEENSRRRHSGLKRVLAAALNTLKRDAGLV